MLLSHGWPYDISALVSREGGRCKNADSSGLIVLSETADLLTALRAVSMPLFKSWRSPLLTLRIQYVVHRTWKPVGNMWNSRFPRVSITPRVTVEFLTVTLRSSVKDLASCFLFVLIPDCFPLAHSVLAPQGLLFLKSSQVPLHTH